LIDLTKLITFVVVVFLDNVSFLAETAKEFAGLIARGGRLTSGLRDENVP
jgi:hypothetical protein